MKRAGDMAKLEGGGRYDLPMTRLRNTLPHIKTAVPGVAWPAIPSQSAHSLLMLQFQFQQTEWMPRRHILDMQLAQLGLVLQHCWKTVPFYRSRLEQAGYSPGRPASWDLLRRLPPLTREQIQDAGVDLHSKAVPSSHGRLTSSSTSGSTGEPVVTRGTELNKLFWRAITLRDHVWRGRDLMKKLCVIRGLPRGQAEYPGKLYKSWGGVEAVVSKTGPAALLNQMTPADQQLDWLVQHNPHYLLTMPPIVFELAKTCLERNIMLNSLLEVQTLGGLVTQEMRDTVRAAWGVPVVDMYSAQEVGYIALQSPDHQHYLVQAENLIVEVVDDNGEWVGPGQWGKVLVSPLHNFAMPLLRYDLGDYAEVGDPCPEGRGLPVLNRVLGRARNMMTLPDGRRIFPAFSTGWFSGFPVRRFQIVQKSLDRIEAVVVLHHPIDSETQEKMRTALAAKLCAPYHISFRFVHEIEKSPSGKFEDFRSELP